MEKINILISIKQENYINYLVLLESLVHKNQTNNIALFILGKETDVNTYSDITKLLDEHDVYYEYYNTIEENPYGLDRTEMSVILSPYILPSDINKILYLNANILIKGKLTELWKIDIQNFLFAACEDRLISKGVNAKELEMVSMSEKDIYYNVDVLIINVQAIKEVFPKGYFELIEFSYNEKLAYGIKSFMNKYFIQYFMEIKEKRYNTQLISYRANVLREKFDEAIIVNYMDIDMLHSEKRDIYIKAYNLWWYYAEMQGILHRNLIVKNKEEKCFFWMDYLRFTLKKLMNPELSIGVFNTIELLDKSSLWDSLYFTERKKIEYEKKYKRMVTGYKKVQVHRLPCGGAAIFFLAIICYKMFCNEEGILHILIPTTLLSNSSADNPNFYVHNECALKYLENAYIPKKEEVGFLRYILSKYFYLFDFSHRDQISPSKYEMNGGNYEGLEKLEVIKFSNDDIQKGKDFLSKNNIKGRFVCIAPRNNEYKKVYVKTVGANDYLDFRNGSIESYLKAAKLIKSEGFELIQMGKINKKSFPAEYGILNFSKVYDELIDLYIFSKCSFVIGDGSGLLILSNMFAKPKVQANTEIITTYKEIMGFLKEGNDIILPTKYWNEKEKHYLSLREQLEFEAKCKRVRFEEQIIESGYKAVPNTAEELELAAREMIDCILGDKQYLEEEKYLQKISRELIMESAERNHMYYPKCNIAIGFLKQNRWYLE